MAPSLELLIDVAGGTSLDRTGQTWTSRPIDPVTLEVIRNALPAISDEMSADLHRTSYNMMIYEVGDYCCALVEPER